MAEAPEIAPQRAWGKGRLVAKPFAGRTRLAEFYQEGCAKIRLPDTFDATMEAVLINSSGGLTGGDHMEWEFSAGEGTISPLTTQACEKIYKASAGTAAVVGADCRGTGRRCTGCRRRRSCSTAPRCRAGSMSISPKAPSSWPSRPCFSAARRWARSCGRGCFRTAGVFAGTVCCCMPKTCGFRGDIAALTRRGRDRLAGRWLLRRSSMSARDCEQHCCDKLRSADRRASAAGSATIRSPDEDKLIARSRLLPTVSP